MVIPLIFISTIMWDTLLYFTAPLDKNKEIPSVSRAVMRKCHQRIKRIQPSHAAFYLFSVMWFILSGSISVSCAAYHRLAPLYPFKLASVSIAGPPEHTTYLYMLVDPSPESCA
jgi:hypothetical protein